MSLAIPLGRKMAFLDVACISQTDEALKGVGLISASTLIWAFEITLPRMLAAGV